MRVNSARCRERAAGPARIPFAPKAVNRPFSSYPKPAIHARLAHAAPVEVEQTTEVDVLGRDRSKPEITHALYKADQAILPDAARAPDIRHFSFARRAGGARGLWPHPATSQHRRFHASLDRLRGSALGNAVAGDLSGVQTR